MCGYLYLLDFQADKYGLTYSGGGRVENTTSDNGAIPCRWMVYEAMLAGLEMTPSWSGFKAEDLEPKIGKDPMTPLYQVLEYLPIQWEVHPKIRLPPSTNGEEHPSRSFSRLVVSVSSCTSI